MVLVWEGLGHRLFERKIYLQSPIFGRMLVFGREVEGWG
jgi:hypothetical protein